METEGWGARLLSLRGRGRAVGGRRVRAARFRRPRVAGGRPAVDGDRVRVDAAARVRARSRLGPGPAGRRADRRQLALGARRPALLGGRGRGVHQRPDRRRRRVLRGRRLADRRAAGGRAPRRRRLELRAGQRLGPLVVRTARSTCWKGCWSSSGRPAARRRPARRAASGEEYLLERSLFRRLGTGEPADERFLRFLHPNRWRYDVLRALDHFRAAAALTGAAPDPRLAEAVDHVRSRRLDDGTWPLDWTPARPRLVRRRRRAGRALALGDAARAARARWWDGARA